MDIDKFDLCCSTVYSNGDITCWWSHRSAPKFAGWFMYNTYSVLLIVTAQGAVTGGSTSRFNSLGLTCKYLADLQCGLDIKKDVSAHTSWSRNTKSPLSLKANYCWQHAAFTESYALSEASSHLEFFIAIVLEWFNLLDIHDVISRFFGGFARRRRWTKPRW